MPRLDGTGPMGQGPMAGRGMGYCGCGCGRSGGRRYLSVDESIALLEDEAHDLEADLKVVRERIAEIKSA